MSLDKFRSGSSLSEPYFAWELRQVNDRKRFLGGGLCMKIASRREFVRNGMGVKERGAQNSDGLKEFIFFGWDHRADTRATRFVFTLLHRKSSFR